MQIKQETWPTNKILTLLQQFICFLSCSLGSRYNYSFILSHLNFTFSKMDSKRQAHELLGTNAKLTISAVCVRLHCSPCCPYCKPRLRGWKISTFKKKQIISPQNRKGNVTVSNSYKNLFWNNFSAAKINMPFRKVLFVDHWLQNCYYRSSIISTYFLKHHDKIFLIKEIEWQLFDKFFPRTTLTRRQHEEVKF